MEPAIAVTVVFDIQPIDAYIRAEGENVLYLAGFARGISDFHSVFQRAEEIIVNKDIHTIVWCGDVIKIDSFTAFIPYLIQQSIASNRPIQKLVAIMYEKSGEEYCLDQRFEAKDLGDTANTQKVPVYTIALPNDGEPDYFELAKRVLEMSKASTILALGGGECIGQEYIHSRNNPRDDKQVEWLLFPIEREDHFFWHKLDDDHKVNHPPHFKLYLDGSHVI